MKFHEAVTLNRIQLDDDSTNLNLTILNIAHKENEIDAPSKWL